MSKPFIIVHFEPADRCAIFRAAHDNDKTSEQFIRDLVTEWLEQNKRRIVFPGRKVPKQRNSNVRTGRSSTKKDNALSANDSQSAWDL